MYLIPRLASLLEMAFPSCIRTPQKSNKAVK